MNSWHFNLSRYFRIISDASFLCLTVFVDLSTFLISTIMDPFFSEKNIFKELPALCSLISHQIFFHWSSVSFPKARMNALLSSCYFLFLSCKSASRFSAFSITAGFPVIKLHFIRKSVYLHNLCLIYFMNHIRKLPGC